MPIHKETPRRILQRRTVARTLQSIRLKNIKKIKMGRTVSLKGNADYGLFKIKEIADINEETDMGTWTKVLSYKIVLLGANMDFTFKSMGSMTAKNWNKKFYLSQDGQNVRFSRECEMLAIIEILKAKKDEYILAAFKSGSLDIDNLIGKSFECVYINLQDKEPFIDWVATFEKNSVNVPTIEQLGGVSDDSLLDEEEKAPAKVEAMP